MPWKKLEMQDFLIPKPPPVFISCKSGHSAEIHWLTNKQGENIPYRCCAECGYELMNLQEIRCWSPVLEPILKQLVQKFEIRGVMQAVIPNVFWKLGRKKTKEFVYIRRLLPDEREMILKELMTMPQAVVITGTKATLQKIQQEKIENLSISLEEIAEINEQGEFHLNFPIIADILGDLVKPVYKPSRLKTPPKRDQFAAKIEKLTRELKQYLKNAREHALATAKNSNIQFLPPPTMEELAKWTNMSKSSVYRCINDKEANTLKFLWDKAHDTKAILQ
jgi:hypothetical protein